MIQLATNTGVLILAIIAVSGIAIFTNSDTLFPASDTKISTAGHSALMVSNVEVIKRDGAGNIVAYRQGDNHIVLGGMELIARQVFGSGGGNNTNTTGIDPTGNFNFGAGLVRYMSIGNGSDGGDCTTTGGAVNLGFDNMTLECPLYILAQNCLRETAVINRFNATEKPTATDQAQINITAVATFSGALDPNSCAADNIAEAGIWQNLTGGPGFYAPEGPETGNIMFARNSFGSVNLSTSDSLELTWKFTFTDS